MPIYTYTCKKCGKQFDLLIGMTVNETELKCPKCGNKDIEKIFSGSFNIRGSGISGCPACSTGKCDLS
ncbi:MAG: hypothetical protein AMJ43_02945 [Coxiella sp. DG_40]|nr:MAG: hypothetical protein AMJ43_02945 [Coxiella sp. DG_40]